MKTIICKFLALALFATACGTVDTVGTPDAGTQQQNDGGTSTTPDAGTPVDFKIGALVLSTASTSATIRYVAPADRTLTTVKFRYYQANVTNAPVIEVSGTVGNIDITIPNLAPNTAYEGRVVVTSTSGIGESDLLPFNTGVGVDGTAARLEIQFGNPSETTINVIYSTDKPLEEINLHLRNSTTGQERIVPGSPSNYQIHVSDLSPGTSYSAWLKGRTKAPALVLSESQPKTFTTTGSSQNPAQNVEAWEMDVATNGATIKFLTVPAVKIARVRFGISQSQLDFTKDFALPTGGATSGEVSLVPFMLPDTQYYYQVEVQLDTSSPVNKSLVKSFRTLGATNNQPAFNCQVVSKTYNSANVQCVVTNNKPLSSFRCEHRTSTSGQIQTTGTVNSPLFATCSLTGLAANTDYFVSGIGMSAGTEGRSAELQLKTDLAPVTDSNPPVFSLTTTFVGSTAVLMQVSSNEDLKQVTVEYWGSGIPTQSKTFAVNGKTSNFVVDGLTSSTAYSFRATALDLAGNSGSTSSPGVSSGTFTTASTGTTNPTPFVIVGTHGQVAASSAVISWAAGTTPQSVWVVHWTGTSQRPSNVTPIPGTIDSAHPLNGNISLTGLPAASTVYWCVGGLNQAGVAGEYCSQFNTLVSSNPNAPPTVSFTFTPDSSSSVLVNYSGSKVLSRVRFEYWPGTVRPNSPFIIEVTPNSQTGTFNVSGLISGQLYSYSAVPTDHAGLTGSSVTGTFTTAGGSTQQPSGNVRIRGKNTSATLKIYHPTLPVNSDGQNWVEVTGFYDIAQTTLCIGPMQRADQNEVIHVYVKVGGMFQDPDSNPAEFVLPNGVVVQPVRAASPHSGAVTVTRQQICGG